MPVFGSKQQVRSTLMSWRAARLRTTRDGYRAFVEDVLVRIVGKKMRIVAVVDGRNWLSSWCLVLAVLKLWVKMQRIGRLQFIIGTSRRIFVCYEIRMVCNRWRVADEMAWKDHFDGMKHDS